MIIAYHIQQFIRTFLYLNQPHRYVEKGVCWGNVV